MTNAMTTKSRFAPLLPLLLLFALLAPVLSPVAAAASAAAASAADEPQDPQAEDATAAEQQEPETYSNTIRWTTASEVDNFGFDVYRSENEDGPFDVLTAEPVEGGGTVDEPRKYVFVDDTIDPSKAYYYYVESISMSGVRERFTPVVKAKPKKPHSEE